MKVELNIPQELVDQIADEVLQRLLPAIVANGKCKDDSILNVKELTEYLKVDENWIYQRTRNHKIPFIKKGKYCLFRKSAIDAWLNRDAIKPLSSFAPLKKIR
ncbi:MAG: helix-turn-helix domain-containing protein [Smithellaceae bacterium]